MSDQSVPVAIIGVAGIGQMTLRGLAGSDCARVVGVSDRVTGAADRIAHQVAAERGGPPAPVYSDNRSLLAETRPRAVFLAVPPYLAPPLVAACAERGIHVWTEAPPARNLAEGVAMVRRMDEAGLLLAVGTQRRFTMTYRRAFELRHRLGRIFLGRAHYLFNWGPQLGWRGDAEAAGGGALMELGYHPIDLMLWLRGLPEQVYGLAAEGNRPDTPATCGATLPVYDTDDTAAAILRYADGGMATVVTTRSSGPVSEELCLHGRRGSLRTDDQQCLLRDPDGNLLDSVAEEAPPRDIFRRQAEAFVHAVAAGANRYEASARENLLNLAVVEAIYLSNRTHQPETPLRLLNNHGLSVEDCLAARCVEDVDEQVDLPPEQTSSRGSARPETA
ncbi:MAG: Gfo/Idh/MocA family oxidoreductase [Phycisphaerae bacterium]|nr:Gfo/Idh/MocA family oxidoreductase [Phycisphaerae bacterium]